jgi:uncharacterized membrane protein
MPTIFELSALAAALGSGLVAGVCFAFAAFVLRALDRLGPAPAIRAMQAINATILRSGAMGVWFGTAAIGLLAAALAEEPGLTAASAVLYGIGAVVITRGGQCPAQRGAGSSRPRGPRGRGGLAGLPRFVGAMERTSDRSLRPRVGRLRVGALAALGVVGGAERSLDRSRGRSRGQLRGRLKRREREAPRCRRPEGPRSHRWLQG